MSLNNIIRTVPLAARSTYPAPGFSVVAVHAEKLKVTERVPWLSANDYKYFHISTAGRDMLAPRDRSVTDDHGQRRMWRIHLGAITGSALPHLLALSVAQNGSAEDVVWNTVNKAIDSKIHELGMSGESAVTKPSTEKFELISLAVNAELLADLGLSATATIRPAIDIKQVEQYKTEEFQTKLEDMRADDTLRLCLEVDVQTPVTQAAREALIGILPDREDIILSLQAAIQSWLARMIRLQVFCYEEDRVRTELIEECKKLLPEGLSILSLSLHWLNPFKRDFLTEATRAVACKVGANLTPMTIHHTLSIQLVDIAKWRKAHVPNEDLGRWIDARLDAITSSVLSQKSYVEVMTEFAKVKRDIKEPFAREIEAIGFRAMQHIAHTQNRELEKILETRTFDVETAGEEFTTKSGTVCFGLRIAAQIKLANLTKVTGFIEPNIDFKAPFVEALRSGAEQAIRKLTPESLYEVFHSDNESPPVAEAWRQSSVIDVTPEPKRADDAIKEQIRIELAVYNANQLNGDELLEGKDIDLTFVPTAIDRIYSALRPRAPKELELEVEAHDETGGEAVTIDMMYGLHIAQKGWTRFHQQCHNLLNDPSFAGGEGEAPLREAKVGQEIASTIHRLIKQNAESKLSLMPLEFFVAPSAGGNRMAEAVALYGFSSTLKTRLQSGEEPQAQGDSVVKRLEDDYGIRVVSRGFRVNLTPSQVALRKLRTEERAYKIKVLERMRENEMADLKTLLPDDRQLEQRKEATKNAQTAANTAITEDSPLARNRENLRRIANELTNIFDLEDGEQAPPPAGPKS